jgi:hypothetical protein
VAACPEKQTKIYGTKFTAKIQQRLGRKTPFQLGLLVAIASALLWLKAVKRHEV